MKAFLGLKYFQTEIKGLTGFVKYDDRGLRSVFSLDIIELGKDGVEKVRRTAILCRL